MIKAITPNELIDGISIRKYVFNEEIIIKKELIKKIEELKVLSVDEDFISLDLLLKSLNN